MLDTRFAVAVERWPMMLARLLLMLVASEVEGGLDGDLRRARRLAVLVGEPPETIAALGRTLVEPPPRAEKTPQVELELAEWRLMRAQMLLAVIELAGSAKRAQPVLGVQSGWLRRELRRSSRAVRW